MTAITLHSNISSVISSECERSRDFSPSRGVRNNRVINILYWVLPVVLIGAQALYIFQSFSQIRFEELIESVQGVWWFQNHQIISGLHSNVGWYGLLLGVYKIFGFGLDVPKFVLLFIYGGFVVSTAVLLRRFLSILPAAVCLLTVGLSPTILSYNTQSLHLAVGMQILPVVILLFLGGLGRFGKLGGWFLMMVGALIYPPFVFYIPSLGLFYILRFIARGPVTRSSRPTSSVRVFSDLAGARRDGPPLAPPLALAFFFFLLPLAFTFLWVENREILVLDRLNGTGLFRGGGKIEISESVFSQAWSGLVRDFFIKAGSYHFEVDKVDFSLGFPIISLAALIYVVWWGYRGRVYPSAFSLRMTIKLILLVIFLNLFIVSITSDYGIPAMKRSTPTLAGIYALWIVAWYYLINLKFKVKNLKLTGGFLLSLLLIHHLIVYPINFAHIKDPSPFRDLQWFATSNTPQKSLDGMLETLKKEDLKLDCRQFLDNYTSCSYEFVYSALALSCYFNKLDCHKIEGYDFTQNNFVELSVEYFRNMP